MTGGNSPGHVLLDVGDVRATREKSSEAELSRRNQTWDPASFYLFSKT